MKSNQKRDYGPLAGLLICTLGGLAMWALILWALGVL